MGFGLTLAVKAAAAAGAAGVCAYGRKRALVTCPSSAASEESLAKKAQHKKHVLGYSVLDVRKLQSQSLLHLFDLLVELKRDGYDFSYEGSLAPMLPRFLEVLFHIREAGFLLGSRSLAPRKDAAKTQHLVRSIWEKVGAMPEEELPLEAALKLEWSVGRRGLLASEVENILKMAQASARKVMATFPGEGGSELQRQLGEAVYYAFFMGFEKSIGQMVPSDYNLFDTKFLLDKMSLCSERNLPCGLKITCKLVEEEKTSSDNLFRDFYASKGIKTKIPGNIRQSMPLSREEYL